MASVDGRKSSLSIWPPPILSATPRPSYRTHYPVIRRPGWGSVPAFLCSSGEVLCPRLVCILSLSFSSPSPLYRTFQSSNAHWWIKCDIFNALCCYPQRTATMQQGTQRLANRKCENGDFQNARVKSQKLQNQIRKPLICPPILAKSPKFLTPGLWGFWPDAAERIWGIVRPKRRDHPPPSPIFSPLFPIYSEIYFSQHLLCWSQYKQQVNVYKTLFMYTVLYWKGAFNILSWPKFQQKLPRTSQNVQVCSPWARGGVYTHNYTPWSGSRDRLETLKIIVGKGTIALFVPLLNVQPTPSFPTRHSFNPAFTG